MKYYIMSKNYRRDVFFYPNNNQNLITQGYLITNRPISQVPDIDELYYQIDKIDNYIGKYDVLPTIGKTLVSRKMKTFLEEIAFDVCTFIPSIIEDKKGNINSDFFTLDIASIVDCFDMEKSEYSFDDEREYPYSVSYVRSVFFDYSKLGDYHIYKMINPGSIIVSEQFIKEARRRKIHQLAFIKEGSLLAPEYLE